jgi:hypothetical protein
MYSADFHTHSLCSPDGSFPMERMALAAMEAGLQEICFTDHWDLLDHRGNFCFTYDWNPVRAQFAEAVARCGEKIRIRFGLSSEKRPKVSSPRTGGFRQRLSWILSSAPFITWEALITAERIFIFPITKKTWSCVLNTWIYIFPSFSPAPPGGILTRWATLPTPCGI